MCWKYLRPLMQCHHQQQRWFRSVVWKYKQFWACCFAFLELFYRQIFRTRIWQRLRASQHPCFLPMRSYFLKVYLLKFVSSVDEKRITLRPPSCHWYSKAGSRWLEIIIQIYPCKIICFQWARQICIRQLVREHHQRILRARDVVATQISIQVKMIW